MKKSQYETITGRRLSLAELSPVERELLARVEERYAAKPEWSEFGAWWPAQLQEAELSETSPAYRICQDLEARLGIAQGKVAMPDYRDSLADLIEEQYGSRYRFCQETGIDPGHLSRVLAGRSELSVTSLQEVLRQLGAVLVVQRSEAAASRFGSKQAARVLAGAP